MSFCIMTQRECSESYIYFEQGTIGTEPIWLCESVAS